MFRISRPTARRVSVVLIAISMACVGYAVFAITAPGTASAAESVAAEDVPGPQPQRDAFVPESEEQIRDRQRTAVIGGGLVAVWSLIVAIWWVRQGRAQRRSPRRFAAR